MRRITAAKLEAQSGAKKRGFWKDPETLEVLKQVRAGQLSVADAATLLSTTPAAIKWYIAERKPKAPKAAPIEHGTAEASV